MTAFHDLLHQVYSVYLSSKDLAKELERLGVGQANFATDPTSTDLWRAERALRAGKLRSLVNDPFRSHKLWKTVQATAQVNLTYFCDLMKQGDFISIQDVVQAKWSMLTMTREDDSNPWLCAIGTLWSLLQPAEWVECSPFLAIGCLYYVAAGLLVKVLCVPQAYHLHDLGKKHNFASHLLIEIERRAEQFDCRRPLCNKRQCICGPANTSVLRNPVALKFKPVANIIY